MLSRNWISFFSSLLLLCAVSARAELPDLRGLTFPLQGTFVLNGAALGQNLSQTIPIDADDGAKVILYTTGPVDNSDLTGALPLPSYPTVVNGVTYSACPNPTVPLTGKFNRTTGAFTMSGKLSGDSVLDLGVQDTGVPFGIKRVLIKLRNLQFTVSGTGAVGADGVFRITQPNAIPVQFDIDSGFLNGTPRVALQDPAKCSFGGTPATIDEPSLALKDAKLELATVAGTLGLGLVPMAPAQTITFDFRAPGTTNALFTRTAALNGTGAYSLLNVPEGTYDVGIKGPLWLRTTRQNVSVTTGQVTTLDAVLRGGNANGDNSVNFDDFQILADAYFTTQGVDPLYDTRADFDGNGEVNFDDFQILADNYFLDGDE